MASLMRRAERSRALGMLRVAKLSVAMSRVAKWPVATLAMWPVAMSRLATLAQAMLLLVAAGCGPDEGNEARLFLDRYEGLDVNVDDLGERRRRVASLERLAIASERVQGARESCLAMHEALLEAEEQQAEARRLVTVLERSAPESRTADAVASVDHALTRSADAATRVRALRPECDEKLADLRARF